MSDADKIVKIVDKPEIRRVEKTAPAVVQTDQATIQTVGCEKVVLKVSYRGPMGPKGDTATFNDLDIPSLAARFLGGLD